MSPLPVQTGHAKKGTEKTTPTAAIPEKLMVNPGDCREGEVGQGGGRGFQPLPLM